MLRAAILAPEIDGADHQAVALVLEMDHAQPVVDEGVLRAAVVSGRIREGDDDGSAQRADGVFADHLWVDQVRHRLLEVARLRRVAKPVHRLLGSHPET